jgi:hypothetical protein
MLNATSLPVINRSENPASGHLSEGSMAVSCGSESRRPDVRFSLFAHASHEGLNDRNGSKVSGDAAVQKTEDVPTQRVRSKGFEKE